MRSPHLEAVGIASDGIDNLIAAASLPMDPQFHLAAILSALPGVRDALREAYVAMAGENPWQEH